MQHVFVVPTIKGVKPMTKIIRNVVYEQGSEATVGFWIFSRRIKSVIHLNYVHVRYFSFVLQAYRSQQN